MFVAFCSVGYWSFTHHHSISRIHLICCQSFTVMYLTLKCCVALLSVLHCELHLETVRAFHTFLNICHCVVRPSIPYAILSSRCSRVPYRHSWMLLPVNICCDLWAQSWFKFIKLLQLFFDVIFDLPIMRKLSRHWKDSIFNPTNILHRVSKKWYTKLISII